MKPGDRVKLSEIKGMFHVLFDLGSHVVLTQNIMGKRYYTVINKENNTRSIIKRYNNENEIKEMPDKGLFTEKAKVAAVIHA